MTQPISNCRLCKSPALSDVFSLGDHFINTFPDHWPADVPHCPITVCVCEDCQLIQLRHTAPNDLLYSRKYWYQSGTNDTIKSDLKEIAEIAQGYLDRDVQSVIIDVGANDGTLLSYIAGNHTKIGIEPATNLTVKLKENADEVHADFWESYKGSKAEVITAIGMFYDLEDPKAFMDNVKEHLQPDGVFIAQLMTAKQMLATNDIGNLCHEHLEFYTWETLKRLFEQSGLEIFKVEENGINGGSYRLFARHFEEGHCDFHEEPIGKEELVNFEAGFKDTMRTFKTWLKDKKNVYIYGASTKGNTILQTYGIGPDQIVAAIDKDPGKHGRFTLTGIPIVDESHISKADYLWCIPYGFLEQFKGQEKDFKGHWVVVMPKFKVI